MLYRTEFPDYDDILRIPKGFTDCSYHNDVCPHVSQVCSKNGTEIRCDIWQDYLDPNKREYSEYPQFYLYIRVNDEAVFEYTTDEWSEIEELLPCLFKMDGWKNELEGGIDYGI